jgi:excisionase family DNA binding protein
LGNNIVALEKGDRGMLSSDLLSGANAAAAFIGVTPRAVYHLVEAGHLPAIKKGRKLYFRKSELERAFSAEAA